MLVDTVNFDFFQSFQISRELIQKVPPHSIHVGLANFFCKFWMMLVQKCVEVFVAKEMLLLYYLSINVW